MERRRIEHTAAGMTVALPVYHPVRHGTILVRPGIDLDDSSITKIDEMGVNYVWVEAPATARVDDTIALGLIDLRARLMKRLHTDLEQMRESPSALPSFEKLRELLAELIDFYRCHSRVRLFAHEPELYGQPLLRSAVNVCDISMLLGMRLENYLIRERPKIDPKYAADVSGLAMAALLHDVGVMRLEQHIVDHWLENHDEQDQRWRRHVRFGYEMVRGVLEPSAAAAVLNHHQAFDGSGFPCRVGTRGEAIPTSGRRLHIFARIIAAAEMFERLRFPPGTNQPRPTVSVLKEMLSTGLSARFDPEVLAGLLAVVPPYPPGARVTLSTGEAGVVVAVNPSAPCKSVVRVAPGASDVYTNEPQLPRAVHDDTDESLFVPEAVEDPDNPDAEPTTPNVRIYDLTAEPEVIIMEIDGHDVSMDNFAGRGLVNADSPFAHAAAVRANQPAA